MTLSVGEWIAVVGIGLATIIGIVQLVKSQAAKSSGAININQTSGHFSKGKQTIKIKTDQSGK
ncbi:MAG: hypothetical protein ACRCTP_17505 [Aeromonas popoffii]|uniref:hypothetical protein n=1 Tax=Aeromonas popoffii TaxID=70856 RepID=UPI003F36B6FD